MSGEVSLAGAGEIQCERTVYLTMWRSVRTMAKSILKSHALQRTAP
jgi:hypothetical protein